MKKRKQTKIMGANHEKFWQLCTHRGTIRSIDRVVKKLAKNKDSKFKKNKKGLPVADVEFAGENGLEKIAIKAQKNHNQ